MGEFRIQQARAADISTVLSLAEHLHYMHNPAPFDSAWKANWLASFLEQETNVAFVAYSDSPVGYLLAERRMEEYSNQPLFYIREIYVEERHRRKGYGTTLINHAADRALRLGYAYVMLNVRAGNSSEEFFHKCGFNHFSSELKLLL